MMMRPANDVLNSGHLPGSISSAVDHNLRFLLIEFSILDGHSTVHHVVHEQRGRKEKSR
jgi:hypothetical protein